MRVIKDSYSKFPKMTYCDYQKDKKGKLVSVKVNFIS